MERGRRRGRGGGKALKSALGLIQTLPDGSSDDDFTFPSGDPPCFMSAGGCLCPLDWLSRGLKPWWKLTKLYWAVLVYGGTRVCGALITLGKNRDLSKYFISSVIYYQYEAKSTSLH